jgi:hypothetical protein
MMLPKSEVALKGGSDDMSEEDEKMEEDEEA